MHENLWAPWRMAYLNDLSRRVNATGGAPQTRSHAFGDPHDWPIEAPRPDTDQFLVNYFNTPDLDETNHVVFRNSHGIILLNRYPYANGHLMIALGDARPALLDYDAEQRVQFWRLIEIAMDLMQRTLSPQGVNVGINQGSAAGAGIPGHLHAHLVPRWAGDTNFISVVGHVRVIPQSLEAMAGQYRQAAAGLAG